MKAGDRPRLQMLVTDASLLVAASILRRGTADRFRVTLGQAALAPS